MAANTLVIISHYDRRPISNLIGLLDSMQSNDAGESYDVCVVVNRTSDKQISLGESYNHLNVLYRHNIGMNIGAWEYGWRSCSGYDSVLFLQDDCYIVRENWLTAINAKLSRAEIGLIGEAANTGWDIPWRQLKSREVNVNLPEHRLNDKPANRVDVYLDFLRRNNVPASQTGYHMRALVWAAKTTTLRQINGFPQGRNYGECIASEIAVTKKIQALGLLVENLSNYDFSYIRHLEWNQDYPGGPFSKVPTSPQKIHKLTKENELLKAQIRKEVETYGKANQKTSQPKWKRIANLSLNKKRRESS